MGFQGIPQSHSSETEKDLSPDLAFKSGILSWVYDLVALPLMFPLEIKFELR